MTIHSDPFEGAGNTYLIRSVDPALDGTTIKVEDYWDRVTGREFWLTPIGLLNGVCIVRHLAARLPRDEEIVLGTNADGAEVAVHTDELGATVSDRSVAGA